MIKVKRFTQLSEEERIKIEVLLRQGLSMTAIAGVLERSVSTVSRELRRNQSARSYTAVSAQVQTMRRHRVKPKRIIFDEQMKAFVCEQLYKKKWSPELISVAGRRQLKNFVSHEWIYQWIWNMKFSQAARDKPYSHLYEYLRHASRKRKRGRKRHMRGNILERKWIDERPREAKQRKVAGHLEADIVLGKDRKPGLLVAIERKTRKVWIRKLKSKDAGYVMGLVSSICKQYKQVKTITFDNDQSFAQHYRLNEQGIATYFTHPYSSQEKGSVENRIGIIRMFFGKKTEFHLVKNNEVRKVEKLINERPLRMFNYKTPNELFEKNRLLH
jgi:transposase, IS30 family